VCSYIKSSMQTPNSSRAAMVGVYMHACKVQNGRNDTTYSSALDSARAGLALLPAAAEAKEGGAIVVVLWLEEEVAVGRIDAFEGQRFWYAECGNTSV
jgi:hypothetical protein